MTPEVALQLKKKPINQAVTWFMTITTYNLTGQAPVLISRGLPAHLYIKW